MISSRVRRLLLLSIPLFFVHGLEEGATGILEQNGFFHRFGRNAVYVLLIELIIIAAVLTSAAVMRGGNTVRLLLLVMAGAFYLYEGDHLLRAVAIRGY